MKTASQFSALVFPIPAPPGHQWPGYITTPDESGYLFLFQKETNMPYWQLFYHLVWATKNREPLLTPEVEPIIYNYIRAKAIGLGATVFALNGWVDHGHLVASIPPKISVATFIGQIKGVTSAKFNQSGHPNAPFFWQDEYAAFSFDYKRLPNYVAYVERQKEHHKNHSTIYALERIEGEGVKMMRESGGLYTVNDEVWRAELDELERLGF